MSEQTTQQDPGGTDGSPELSRARSARLAWVALVAIGLILGFNWVVMKTALDYVHPAVFAAMRISLAAVTLFLVLLILRRPLRPPNWRMTILVGLFGVAGLTGLMFWALESGAASKTSVLVYTMPVWLLIMSKVFLGERVRGYQWFYAGVALMGLVFVISPWSVGGTPVGNLLAIGAGLSSAIGAVLAKVLFRGERVDLLSLNAWQMLAGAVPLVIIAFLTADSGPEWSGVFVVALLYNVLLASALAVMLWFYALRTLPTATAGLGRLIAPVVGVVASALLLGERPDGFELAGMILILAGLAGLAIHQFVSERRAVRAAARSAAAGGGGLPASAPDRAGAD